MKEQYENVSASNFMEESADADAQNSTYATKDENRL